MEIKLRRPNNEDLVTLVDFEFELAKISGYFKENSYGLDNFLKRRFEEFNLIVNSLNIRSNIILGEVTGEVAGYLNYDSHDKRFHIGALYIGSLFRRKGIGKKLLIALIGEAKYKEKQDISVIPVSSAKNFYKSFGFIDSDNYHKGGMVFKVGEVH